MEQNTAPQTSPNEQASSGSAEENASTAQTELAHDDFMKFATRAKKATKGFDFNKLFQGRLDNRNYFYAVIGAVILAYIIGMLPGVGMILQLSILVIGLSVTSRRFQDINLVGWMALVILVPYVNIFIIAYLCWRVGDKGANLFGDAPDPKRDFFKAILNT